MESKYLANLKQQYIAAMSAEMKTPLQMIVQLADRLENASDDSRLQIQNAAQHLLMLVDELADFSQATT